VVGEGSGKHELLTGGVGTLACCGVAVGLGPLSWTGGTKKKQYRFIKRKGNNISRIRAKARLTIFFKRY
jgi:hypothetical protein